MSPRPRVTFAKRQKEQARQEKQRAKAERKLQRKLENQAGVRPADGEELAPSEEAAPESSPQSSPHLEQLNRLP